MSIQVFKAHFEVEECLAEIQECLERGWTGMGFKTVEFEERWMEYTGLPYAHFLNSATAGLYLAFETMKEHLGWKDGDEVVTTPLTFVSTNHAIAVNGLTPVFADIDETLCLDPASVLERLSERTKAVVFVGIGGNTGHLEEVVRICEARGIALVLDAAHMAGTCLKGANPASLADVSVWSYQAVKNLPTADSGMICFKDGEMDRIVREKSWLGINKDTYHRSGEGGSYKWRYDVEYVGYKYHGNSIMAAIALAQLPFLERDNAYRRQLARWYEELLAPLGKSVGYATIPAECESSRHLFQILVEDRDGLMAYLNDHEIFPGVHYVDNTEYRMYRYASGTCPRARQASEHVISLPMHLGVTKSDVELVCRFVANYLKRDER